VNLWAVLDTLPEYIAVVDMQGTILYLNATWYQLILERAVGAEGFNVGSDFLTSFANAFGHGGADVRSLRDGLNDVIQGKQEHFFLDYPYSHLGEKQWFTLTITPTYITSSVRGAIIHQKNNTKQKQESDLLYAQATVLRTVNASAEQFLRGSNLHQNIQTLLHNLGKTMGVSRAYIFENHLGKNDDVMTSQRYMWIPSENEPKWAIQTQDNISYRDVGLSRWATVLSQGSPVYGNIHTFPENERLLLHRHHVVSLAITPIFVSQQWWGFIGVDDCSQRRLWLLSILDALQAAAGIVGGAIQRSRTASSA